MARSARRALAPAPSSRFVLPAKHRGVLTDVERASAMEHARSLLEAPTAPYAEDAEVAVLRAFVRERPGLSLRVDRHANVVVTWPGARATKKKGSRAPVLAYSAHLDHPGFLRARDPRTATFHGGVAARYMPGARVRFFAPGTSSACATARVASVTTEHGAIVARFDDVAGTIVDGAFGMWDLTPGTVRGTRLHARVCDDLMGAAAILSTLDGCVRAKHASPLVGIFTRAEETGFVGCMGLLRTKELERDVVVVGLECSPKRATARVGLGPVVRVGDKQSVFSPWITSRLHDAAAAMHAENERFVFQRALMDGGSCESTAYNTWGVEAGALCLALGNYHNQGPNERIAPELVDWDDHESLIALMRRVARDWDDDAPSKITVRLNRIWKGEYKRLADSARRIRSAR